MKKTRFSETKIVSILKKQEAGVRTADLCREYGISESTFYNWKDIFYSFWSTLFCGGDCAEDLAVNFNSSFKQNPFVNLPSPDRVLERMKQLAVENATILLPPQNSLTRSGMGMPIELKYPCIYPIIDLKVPIPLCEIVRLKNSRRIFNTIAPV